MNFFSRLLKLRERRRITKTEKAALEIDEQQQMQEVRERLEIVARDLMLLDRRKSDRIPS